LIEGVGASFFMSESQSPALRPALRVPLSVTHACLGDFIPLTELMDEYAQRVLVGLEDGEARSWDEEVISACVRLLRGCRFDVLAFWRQRGLADAVIHAAYYSLLDVRLIPALDVAISRFGLTAEALDLLLSGEAPGEDAPTNVLDVFNICGGERICAFSAISLPSSGALSRGILAVIGAKMPLASWLPVMKMITDPKERNAVLRSGLRNGYSEGDIALLRAALGDPRGNKFSELANAVVGNNVPEVRRLLAASRFDIKKLRAAFTRGVKASAFPALVELARGCQQSLWTFEGFQAFFPYDPFEPDAAVRSCLEMGLLKEGQVTAENLRRMSALDVAVAALVVRYGLCTDPAACRELFFRIIDAEIPVGFSMTYCHVMNKRLVWAFSASSKAARFITADDYVKGIASKDVSRQNATVFYLALFGGAPPVGLGK
jgi:hypothetical protein